MSSPPTTSGPPAGLSPLVLQMQPVVNLSDEQLYAFSQLNRDLRIERNARGELIIMPPTGGETGRRNSELTMQLGIWAKRDGTGTAFDSSTGFRLPNGAVRSPDAAWVRRERLDALTAEQREKFLPLCPDFAVELRSPSDPISPQQDKMREYLEAGCLLGWLIDPVQRTVTVYTPGAEPQTVPDAENLSADPALPGFTLDLREIW